MRTVLLAGHETSGQIDHLQGIIGNPIESVIMDTWKQVVEVTTEVAHFASLYLPIEMKEAEEDEVEEMVVGGVEVEDKRVMIIASLNGVSRGVMRMTRYLKRSQNQILDYLEH